MEFDEYDYLEKAVESREPQKLKEAVDVGEEILESEEKGHSRSSKHRSDRNDDDLNKWSKRSKSGVESRDRDKERGSSRHRSSPRHGERSDRNQPRSSRKHKDGDRDRDRDGDRYRDRDRNGKDRLKDQDRNKDRDRDRDGDGDKDRKERNRGNEKEIDREDRDGERDRDKDRKERNHGNEKETDREDRDGECDLDKYRKEHNRGNEKETDRENRDSERDKDRKERSRGNEKETDREREQLRRSRSRSERHREEHDRERSRDRAENKERERETEPKETRRHKEKKEGGAEPEADPERDQRTVFAYQISLKADERDVYDFFSRAGKVRDVRLIMDRNSRRSKGVGYIEFFDSMSVPMAIALSGQPLLGQPVMVKPSEAEKNLVQSTTVTAGASGGIGPYSGGARRLYVGNLHINMKEDQLRQVFEPFGAVELVQVPIDETGNCKGFGFVQFARLDDARAAQSLNGQLEIAGQVIKVSAVTDQPGMQDFGTNAGDFDDDEGGGLTLNARSRALLMQKLDRSGSTSSVAGSLGNPVVNNPGLALPGGPILGAAPPVPPITVPSADIVGVPSECLMLKNMFDPKLETEPDFDLDIKEDVEDECSKFGALRHIYVDKNTAGFVYLRFENTQSAMGAQRSLHGRWFAGKMITATFMLPQSYEAKFPDSR